MRKGHQREETERKRHLAYRFLCRAFRACVLTAVSRSRLSLIVAWRPGKRARERERDESRRASLGQTWRRESARRWTLAPTDEDVCSRLSSANIRKRRAGKGRTAGEGRERQEGKVEKKMHARRERERPVSRLEKRRLRVWGKGMTRASGLWLLCSLRLSLQQIPEQISDQRVMDRCAWLHSLPCSAEHPDSCVVHGLSLSAAGAHPSPGSEQQKATAAAAASTTQQQQHGPKREKDARDKGSQCVCSTRLSGHECA